MTCLWRTKASNFRKRCARETSFLLCWQHAWKPLTAIVAFVVFLAALAQCTGFSLRDFVSKALPIPGITCTMEYPIKAEEDKIFRGMHNPDIIISNNGPVSALSVSGNVNAYQYNSQKDAITGYVYQGMKNFDHAFAKEELKPFEDLRHPTTGMTGENILAVYIIDVVFYVGHEMERFERKFRFFVEHKKISDEAKFKKDSRYAHIIQKLGDVDLFTFTGPRLKATAAAKHKWFAEPENWYSARKGEDGKVRILGLPKGQDPSKQAGYPFLELKPHPFKATGLYIKAEIVDDHVEAKTTFAVTNIGDAAALVTEDGFEIANTIEPGQTKYYTKTVNFGRMPGNDHPLENLIKSINESEVAFQIQFSINYRPANDKEQFLKITGHYNVGKHKVTEVANVKKS